MVCIEIKSQIFNSTSTITSTSINRPLVVKQLAYEKSFDDINVGIKSK